MTNIASVSIIKASSLEGGYLSHTHTAEVYLTMRSISIVLREVHLVHIMNSKVSLGPFPSLGVNGNL